MKTVTLIPKKTHEAKRNNMPAEKLDLQAIQAKTQDGRDPQIEKKAMEYSKRDWQMTIEPLFTKLVEVEGLHAVVKSAFKSDAFIAIVQQEMMNHKYEVLENSDTAKTELAKTSLLFARKA